MSTKPFLSICIPAYNVQKTIGHCLESIIEQTFVDYEILIVDDGSDVPLEFDIGDLNRMDMCRIKLVRQENGGTYAARQRAIREACGRYIFCMDADDALSSSRALGHIARALEMNSFPDVLLTNAFREDGTRCVDYSGLSNGEVKKRDVVDRFFFNRGWNSMYTMAFRRSLFSPAADRPRLLMAEDRLQKAEIFSMAETFALFDESVYFYRDVQGSAMNSPFELRDFYNRTYVGNEILGMLDELGANRKAWARSFNGYVAASLFELGMDGRRSRAERLDLYPEFRNTDGCEEALAYIDCVPMWKDRICLEAFNDRKWVLLDALLASRRFASKAKNLIVN